MSRLSLEPARILVRFRRAIRCWLSVKFEQRFTSKTLNEYLVQHKNVYILGDYWGGIEIVDKLTHQTEESQAPVHFAIASPPSRRAPGRRRNIGWGTTRRCESRSRAFPGGLIKTPYYSCIALISRISATIVFTLAEGCSLSLTIYW